jgi:probable HAF family extracellular repeat protein
MQRIKTLQIAGIAGLLVAAHHVSMAACSDPVAVGALGGGESLAWDINNLGQVVGEALTEEGTIHAYLWTNGAMTDLGALDAVSDSVAWGVNDLGQIVGTSDSTDGPRTAMLWDGGVATNVGAAMGATGATVAWDINDAGQVVGQAALVPGFSKAFRWEQGAGLVQYDGDSFYNGTAFIGINEAGVAVGHEFIFLSPDTAMYSEPGRTPGTYTDPLELPGIPGPFSFCWANAVNESGTIIGHANPGTGPWNGVIWTPGPKGFTITPIGTLPELEYSEGEDINDSGLAVGWASDDVNEIDPRAWAWKDGVLFDLNDFLLSDSQWEILLSARAVNNNGDIAGIGRLKTGELQGFVLEGFTGELPGDFNGDGAVDIPDLRILIASLGPCDGCPTDLNCDGVVDNQDLLMFLRLWSHARPSHPHSGGQSAPAPTPKTVGAAELSP